MDYSFICSLCGAKVIGYGNSAEPLSKKACCSDCNENKVIPARLRILTDIITRKRNKKE